VVLRDNHRMLALVADLGFVDDVAAASEPGVRRVVLPLGSGPG